MGSPKTVRLRRHGDDDDDDRANGRTTTSSIKEQQQQKILTHQLQVQQNLKRRKGGELLSIQQAAIHLRDGAGLIVKGYRPHGLTPVECLLSLLYLHNQFFNAWTMIFAFLISSCLCYRNLTDLPTLAPSSSSTSSPQQQLIEELTSRAFNAHVAIWISCLLHAPISAAYHTFRPVSREVFSILKRLDFILIFSSISMAFYGISSFTLENSTIRATLHTIIVVGCAIIVVWSSSERFVTKAIVSRAIQLQLVAIIMVL